MPGISMCKNDNCPLRESCYRFKALPSELWQSYSSWKYDLKTKDCKGYSLIMKGDRITGEKQSPQQ